MKNYYLVIGYRNRVTIRKQKGKSWRDAERRYYHSAAHERTEGSVLGVSAKKRLAMKKKARARRTHYGI